MPPRQVTYEEFRKLECNQCGECCEDFTLPWPLEIVTRLGGLSPNAMEDSSEQWQIEYERRYRWLWDVEPIADASVGKNRSLRYRCHRLVRLDDGKARCSAYEDRPQACEWFPRHPGRPSNPPPVVVGYKSCSWNVEIVDAGPGRRPAGIAGPSIVRRDPVETVSIPRLSDVAQVGWAEAERLAA